MYTSRPARIEQAFAKFNRFLYFYTPATWHNYSVLSWKYSGEIPGSCDVFISFRRKHSWQELINIHNKRYDLHKIPRFWPANSVLNKLTKLGFSKSNCGFKTRRSESLKTPRENIKVDRHNYWRLGSSNFKPGWERSGGSGKDYRLILYSYSVFNINKGFPFSWMSSHLEKLMS